MICSVEDLDKYLSWLERSGLHPETALPSEMAIRVVYRGWTIGRLRSGLALYTGRAMPRCVVFVRLQGAPDVAPWVVDELIRLVVDERAAVGSAAILPKR